MPATTAIAHLPASGHPRSLRPLRPERLCRQRRAKGEIEDRLKRRRTAQHSRAYRRTLPAVEDDVGRLQRVRVWREVSATTRLVERVRQPPGDPIERPFHAPAE